jgi:1-acyl-sn-glycerol-3-phosphate acyltransferase
MRALLLFLFRRIVAIYFREVEVRGDVPAPDTGGRLFGANHMNGLVDPILVLTQAPCRISPVAKSTLWNIPGLKLLLDAAEAVPIVRRKDDPNKSEKDNEAVFTRVASHLGAAGNILIFPEGTSHNEPHLIALRSGAGRMLSRARAAGAKGMTFQSVALEFDARDVFRSRVLVLFGPVREVDLIDVTGDALAEAITTILKDDLSELLVEGATWEERVLLVHVAEMFANENRERSLEAMNRIGRRIEQARRVLAEAAPTVVTAIETKVADYFRALEDADTTDAAVEKFARTKDAGARVAPERLARAAALVLVLPLAAIGAVLYWLPYQVPRLVVNKLGDDPDVASTYKLGVGLLVFPLWAAIAITLAFLRLPIEQAWAATVIAVASPFAALAWQDRWDRIAARARMLAPSEERVERLAALAETRAALLAELETARIQAEMPDASTLPLGA